MLPTALLQTLWLYCDPMLWSDTATYEQVKALLTHVSDDSPRQLSPSEHDLLCSLLQGLTEAFNNLSLSDDSEIDTLKRQAETALMLLAPPPSTHFQDSL